MSLRLLVFCAANRLAELFVCLVSIGNCNNSIAGVLFS